MHKLLGVRYMTAEIVYDGTKRNYKNLEHNTVCEKNTPLTEQKLANKGDIKLI